MKIIFLILLNFSFYSNFSCKKQESKNDPRSKKPESISNELFCVGCVAFAVETVKFLKGRKTETDVYYALQNVCKGQYTTYCNFSV